MMAGTLVSTMINGDQTEFVCQASETLLEVLRNRLGLTGSKEGCGTGDCGACSITLDGRLVCSCLVLAAETEGAEVATIEGQANADGSLNVIQQAFQDHHGLQCGFCTPGMVMAAASLLEQNPKPTEADIRHHLEGNICRCTGYHNIVKAILAASGQEVPAVAAE